jgi:3-oxoacyl-[acyl-carrier protein] reductase
MEIKNKQIIITGGASGLGKAMAIELCRRGALVSIMDRDKERLESVVKESGVAGFSVDITDPKAVENCLDEFAKANGAPDVVINNAGILHSEPLIRIGASGIELHSLDTWHRVVDINFNAVFYVSRCAINHMVRKRKKGLIINISSVAAQGNAGQSAYAASKAGVATLTSVWAKELGPLGIRVAALAPGYTETESTHAALSEAMLKEMVSRVPLKRLAKPEEIVMGIVSIIENDFFSGKVFEIDGGLVL